MSSDQMGWLALVIFVICVIAAVMEFVTVAWVLAAVGIALIIYAKLKT